MALRGTGKKEMEFKKNVSKSLLKVSRTESCVLCIYQIYGRKFFLYLCIYLCTDMNKMRQSSLHQRAKGRVVLPSVINFSQRYADQIYICKESAQFITTYVHTVIRFVSTNAKFGTCTVVSVNGTLAEDKMRRFEGERADFSFKKCPIETHDCASAKFSTNSQETNNSAVACFKTLCYTPNWDRFDLNVCNFSNLDLFVLQPEFLNF